MTTKPIGPTAHGLIDYAFVTLQALAPTLFDLREPARSIAYGFALSQGLLNMLTDHPVGVKRVVPLRVHGQLEVPFVPALLVVPLLAGALKQRNARRYFLSFFAIAATNFVLTDYNAYEAKPHQLIPH
jgi:hypothetical protein